MRTATTRSNIRWRPLVDLRPFHDVEILHVTPANCGEAFEQLRAAEGAIALDTETTGLDPLLDRIRLLQIATGPLQPVLVFDLFAWEHSQLQRLWRFLMAEAGPDLVFHNAVFDVAWLWSLGVEPPTNRIRCTMLQERCLVCGLKVPVYGKGVNPNEAVNDEEDRSYRDVSVSLAEVVKRHLGLRLSKDEQASDWGADSLSDEQLRYAAKDADATLRVFNSQKIRLKRDGVEAVARLENRLRLGCCLDAAERSSCR